MTEYNLTDAERASLIEMVKCADASQSDSFIYFANFSFRGAVFQGVGGKCDALVVADTLRHLAAEDLISIRDDSDGRLGGGAIKRLARAAIAAHFSKPQAGQVQRYEFKPRQEEILRAMVAAGNKLGDDYYLYSDNDIDKVRVGIESGKTPIDVPCSPADLMYFTKLGMVDGPSWNEGTLTERAYRAVENDFMMPASIGGTTNNIGAQFLAPVAGPVQAYAGGYGRQIMNIDNETTDLVERLAAVTAELIEVVKQVVPDADAAAAIASAARAAEREASQPTPNASATAAKGGQVVSGILESVALFGGFVDGVERIQKIMDAVSPWLVVHGANLIRHSG